MSKLILASTSVSRRNVLQKLALPFETIAPVCDETPLPDESAKELVLRLSAAKAASIQQDFRQHFIIGSDQVGVLDGKIIGKPHTAANAIQQLQRCSGKSMTFYTGLCVLDTAQHRTHLSYEIFQVTFRKLTLAEIEAYVAKEQPLHCAGSFKCDALGITLFDKLQGDDINTLIGLPLIRLNKVLIEFGFNPLLH